MIAAGVVTDLNLEFPNWHAMTRRILIDSLRGPNFTIRIAKMNDS